MSMVSGVAREDRVCKLCGHCPGDKLQFVLECAALQGLRDNMLVLLPSFSRVQYLMWQENLKLMPNNPGYYKEGESS